MVATLLPERIECPHCGDRLKLSQEEQVKGAYDCPNCKRVISDHPLLPKKEAPAPQPTARIAARLPPQETAARPITIDKPPQTQSALTEIPDLLEPPFNRFSQSDDNAWNSQYVYEAITIIGTAISLDGFFFLSWLCYPDKTMSGFQLTQENQALWLMPCSLLAFLFLIYQGFIRGAESKLALTSWILWACGTWMGIFLGWHLSTVTAPDASGATLGGGIWVTLLGLGVVTIGTLLLQNGVIKK